MVGRDRRARRQRASPKNTHQDAIQTAPIALTIAGSDSSAGAGVQADLKTFSALGVYGLTVVTCIVAEIPGKVSRIERVSARMVREQIEVLARHFSIDAIKTGLLCSAEIVSAVAQAIRSTRLFARRIPLVVDPVMIATSGERLLEKSAVDAYKKELFPVATLITPNLDEAVSLLGKKIADSLTTEQMARALADKYGTSILLKGGHVKRDYATDVLFHHGRLREFSAPFVCGVATHGTGCTYSAAIAAGLASGLEFETAIEQAKKFVTQSIVRHFRWKDGSGEIVALNQSI